MVQSQGHKEKLLCSLSIPEEGCLWFLVWRFCLNVWHSGEDILIIPVTAKAKRISWMFKHFKNTKKRQQAEVHYCCKKTNNLESYKAHPTKTFFATRTETFVWKTQLHFKFFFGFHQGNTCGTFFFFTYSIKLNRFKNPWGVKQNMWVGVRVHTLLF